MKTNTRKHLLLTLALLAHVGLSACGTYGSPVKTIIAGNDPNCPACAEAIMKTGNDLNARLGCKAFTFEVIPGLENRCDRLYVDDTGTTQCQASGKAPNADLEFMWTTEAQSAAHFPSVKTHGALAAPEIVSVWGPITTPAWLRVWVALDYQSSALSDGQLHVSPDDVAKTWLSFVMYLRGPYQPSKDPQSLMWNHPTLNPDPEGEFFREYKDTEFGSPAPYLCPQMRP